MSLKTKMACSYCTKIFNEPVQLPCYDFICAQHLSEKKVIDENQIKCSKCSQVFRVDESEFLVYDLVNYLLQDESYLSREEKMLKNEMKENALEIHRLNDEFIQTKNHLDLECLNHFQEMRLQIDLHNWELKEKLDDIDVKQNIEETASEMIEKIKQFELVYLKSIDLKLENKIDETLLKKEINEKFRDPFLKIENIKEMRSKQDEIFNELKSKINEMLEIKDHLRKNEFKPFFSQNVKNMFGQLCLYEYNSFDPFKSQILTNNLPFDLIILCEFSIDLKWRLIYRASQDGFGAKDFHLKCDDKYPTLTICKVKECGFIFGGYTEAVWESLREKYRPDSNAFVFSLTNKENRPFKMHTTNVKHSIYCSSSLGPVFGDGHDIYIADNANETMNSYTILGDTYKHPEYVQGSDQVQTFLAGSFEFQLDEIEIYQKE